MTAGLGVTEYAPAAGGPLMRAPRHLPYRRAWLLVDELNKLLSEPVVTTAAEAQQLRRSEKRPSHFTTQSKRTLELPRAANFRPFGN